MKLLIRKFLMMEWHKQKEKKPYRTVHQAFSGEQGIRTLGTRKSTIVFETTPFDHSGSSPSAKV